MHRRLVSDLVLPDDPNIVPQTVSLRTAAEHLLLSDCELLVVTDDSGRLAGVVTESGVVRSLLTAGDSGEGDLSRIVNRHVESIRSDLPLDHVLHLFRSSCYSAVPVIDADESVCGLLRRRDVMEYLLNGRVDCGHTTAATTRTVLPRPASDSAEITPPQPPDESRNPLSRPHFLKGDAARRLLRRDEEAAGH